LSQENVETARAVNDAVRRGDWDAVAEALDPDILVRTDQRWPEQRIYGREALLAWYRGLQESGGVDVRIEEIVDLGDRLLVHIHWHPRGAASGIEGDLRLSELVTIRDGRYIFVEYFLDRAEALKAVGLEE
jgi:ketosteroid isomerase-like protein